VGGDSVGVYEGVRVPLTPIGTNRVDCDPLLRARTQRSRDHRGRGRGHHMPAVPLPVGTAAPAIRSRVGRGSAVTWRCQSMAIAPARHGLDALQVRAPLLSQAHGSLRQQTGEGRRRRQQHAGSVQRSGTSHLQEGAAHRSTAQSRQRHGPWPGAASTAPLGGLGTSSLAAAASRPWRGRAEPGPQGVRVGV
jgi:hypothetical protein